MPRLIGAVVLAVLAGAAAPMSLTSQQRGAVPDTVFRHAQHEALECVSCHRMETGHGELTVRSLQDCRSCHHTQRAMRDCAACHAASEARARLFTLERRFAPTVADDPSVRALPFRHEAHEEVECGTCHQGPPSLGAADLDCESCHEEHHEVTASCMDCHREPAEEAHDASVHVTCSGAGCHQEVPVGGAPRTREGCLWCHEDMTEHEPGGNCATCHLLPEPGGDDPPGRLR